MNYLVKSQYKTASYDFAEAFLVPKFNLDNDKSLLENIIKYSVGSEISLGSQSFALLCCLIEKFWLRESQTIYVSSGTLDDSWISLLARLIAEKGPKRWMTLKLDRAAISDAWFKSLIDAVSTFWFPDSLTLNFEANKITDEWLIYFLNIIESLWSFPQNFKINLKYNNISESWMLKLLDVIRRLWINEWLQITLIDSQLVSGFIKRQFEEEAIRQKRSSFIVFGRTSP